LAQVTSFESSTSIAFRSLPKLECFASTGDCLLRQSVWERTDRIDEITQAAAGWK
jgi:hypothetical protein